MAKDGLLKATGVAALGNESGGEIPKDVLGFISLHKLSDLLTEKAEAKKAKTKGKGNDG